MSAEYAFDTAVMMVRTGRREEAKRLLWEAVKVNPRHGDAWDLRARLELESGNPESALLHQALALQAAPYRWDFWHNKGMIEAACHMFKQAESSFRKAIEMNATWESHFNLGNVLCNQMKVEDAIEHYRQALEWDTTDNAQLRVNYGEAVMTAGHWREGFQHYRHRFNCPNFPPAPRNKYPLWRGEPLDGKTILLFVEQGFGDEILSLRFAARAWTEEKCRVILAVRPPMYRLARHLEMPNLHVMLMYDEPPFAPDFACALLDVPAWRDISPETVPCKIRYLRAEDRGFRLQMPPGLNVGVCWASGKRDLQPHVADTARAKSLSFQQLAPILARPGVNLFSLQQTHSDDAAMRAVGVRDPMSGVTDFADTAFIMDHLDLVVTVDTSVAHLAGAMGKPVWNLVRFDALWPWMQETGKTCWYDSMTLYRQERPFDWAAPLGRLAADFGRFIEEHAAKAA